MSQFFLEFPPNIAILLFISFFILFNQLLAETLAEEQLQNPDFQVTRIVIQKEGEEINGDVEEEAQPAQD